MAQKSPDTPGSPEGNTEGPGTEEDWAMKNRCFQIVVLEKTLKSPLDCKEIKPVNLKENQS